MDTKQDEYPKIIKAREIVNSIFGTDLFSLPGGRVKYDAVVMSDGGNAIYLSRMTPTKESSATNWQFKVTTRWIPWDADIIQHYAIDTGITGDEAE